MQKIIIWHITQDNVSKVLGLPIMLLRVVNHVTNMLSGLPSFFETAARQQYISCIEFLFIDLSLYI